MLIEKLNNTLYKDLSLKEPHSSSSIIQSIIADLKKKDTLSEKVYWKSVILRPITWIRMNPCLVFKTTILFVFVHMHGNKVLLESPRGSNSAQGLKICPN